MSRLHARRVEVIAKNLEGQWRLYSPVVGFFTPFQDSGSCHPGDVVGSVDVLGSKIELVIPAGVHGWIGNLIDPDRISGLVPHFVQYGDPLAALSQGGPLLGASEQAPPEIELDGRFTGPVFRSPTSGRYYGRPGPDKPPFVTVGSELSTGSTICLLEVMKTFHRVTYDGANARVRELLVADGVDIIAGDPLLALEPI